MTSYGNRDPKLRDQIISRLADNLNGGKFRLEPKEDHISRHHSSPDRADAYVLCYSSYPIVIRADNKPDPQPALQSFEDFEEAFTWGNLALRSPNYARTNRRPTSIRRV